MQVDQAVVKTSGKIISGKLVVDFFEFQGVGVPGYSEGPIFNNQNQIIGIMNQAWLAQGIKGGNVFLMNRAYSIHPFIDNFIKTQAAK